MDKQKKFSAQMTQEGGGGGGENYHFVSLYFLSVFHYTVSALLNFSPHPLLNPTTWLLRF